MRADENLRSEGEERYKRFGFILQSTNHYLLPNFEPENNTCPVPNDVWKQIQTHLDNLIIPSNKPNLESN